MRKSRAPPAKLGRVVNCRTRVVHGGAFLQGTGTTASWWVWPVSTASRCWLSAAAFTASINFPVLGLACLGHFRRLSTPALLSEVVPHSGWPMTSSGPSASPGKNMGMCISRTTGCPAAAMSWKKRSWSLSIWKLELSMPRLKAPTHSNRKLLSSAPCEALCTCRLLVSLRTLETLREEPHQLWSPPCTMMQRQRCKQLASPPGGAQSRTEDLRSSWIAVLDSRQLSCGVYWGITAGTSGLVFLESSVKCFETL